MLKFTKKAMSVVAPVILSAAMVFPVSAAEIRKFRFTSIMFPLCLIPNRQ